MLIHIIHCFNHEGLPNNTLLSNVPHDICTISKQLKLESPFEQHVCCPHCYSLYNIEVSPKYCTYKPTISSKPCDTEPFNTFKVYPLPHIQPSSKNPTLTNQCKKLGEVLLKGQKPHHITQERFFSQSVLEWIKLFLNIPGIKKGIEDWAYELSTHQSIAVCNVGQGSVWKDLFLPPSANHPLELGLSIFVYWFNPKGNKISERYQQKHSCLAEVIPSPNQPDMVTINNILKLLIDELIELNRGVKVITPNHPHERYVVVKLVGLIGDIVATHKAGGFMSHLAKYFFSCCELKDIKRAHLKVGKPRKQSAVWSASRTWQEANSTTAQQRLAQYCGI
ncbi:hypothetical protein O181_094848 [Austropuccinia psidii MF-1]|uniref:Uncharacterized protein n=1 Tax=Austropuccinia psidii MF-1 TaxID=1389203 RepID=A0A9Q3J3X8_9BASI|nr:hypothetical protein [Austropuccinia psidii MF-1]